MDASVIMDIDMHLTHLLGNMTLGTTWRKTDIESEERPPTSPISDNHDALMSDSSDTEDSICQSNQSASSKSTVTESEPPPCGCALLQAIRGQVCAGLYPTTGGEYLEAIFTHREVFCAFPQGHRTCALGFSDLAMDLEQRAARSDRDGDAEAVAAFRHEAWVIANAW
ncbi:hypothetical protein AcW1_003471 [Taiwanofungus camphoratus]|nr:hypothetical protein AcV5_002068 [Antrodia cinnamomea]KAI0941623.1 hypothetical protein AcW1_003471 [Antrodia cinnamomea]KAI0943879.1 hypothetical protein AcV7_001844 [Antrodia cinnamomea]